jgi:uncharacterized membrane protein YfcA
MDYIAIIIVAFGASMLTFFSGFGLGTMLTPVFLFFFPPEIAVAITAIVHFLNNLFKLLLVGKHAVKNVIISFGLPAIIGAFAGAAILGWLSQFNQEINLFSFQTTALNLVLGALIFVFALFELMPAMEKKELPSKMMFAGGVMSGFFGGLSGHQGALRSAFLVRFGLKKEQFIASGIVIACLVDTIRISTYAFTFQLSHISENITYILVATLAAFAGAIIGKQLLKKVTIDLLQKFVGGLMLIIAVLLFLGII